MLKRYLTGIFCLLTGIFSLFGEGDRDEYVPPTEYTLPVRHIRDPLNLHDILRVTSGNGRVLKEIRRTSEGELHSQYLYSYSVDGLLTRIELLDENTDLWFELIYDQNRIVEMREHRYGVYEYFEVPLFDDKGHLTHTLLYGMEAVDHLDGSFAHQYNEQGMLTESAFYYRWSYWTDEDGNQAVDLLEEPGRKEYVARFEYEENRISRISYYGQDDSEEFSRLRCYDLYEYDDMGQLMRISIFGIFDELLFTIEFESL